MTIVQDNIDVLIVIVYQFVTLTVQLVEIKQHAMELIIEPFVNAYQDSLAMLEVQDVYFWDADPTMNVLTTKRVLTMNVSLHVIYPTHVVDLLFAVLIIIVQNVLVLLIIFLTLKQELHVLKV